MMTQMCVKRNNRKKQHIIVNAVQIPQYNQELRHNTRLARHKT